jgi:hypothetical protein
MRHAQLSTVHFGRANNGSCLLAFQAAVDEFGLQAQQAQPLPTQPNSHAEPWRCLTACDDAAAACAGAFLTKHGGSWSCWPVELVHSDSNGSGGAKLALGQLDTYLWDMPDQVSVELSESLGC